MATRLSWSLSSLNCFMNARLSTIFFLTVAIGVGIGWYAGRASIEQRMESLLKGNSRYIRARGSIMQNSMYDKSDGALVEGLKRGNIADVFYLYRYSDDVNAYLGYENLEDTAYDMAKELLLKMECNSADAYFDRFKDGYYYGNSSYQQPGTKEYKSFRSFIEKILIESAKTNSNATNAG